MSKHKHRDQRKQPETPEAEAPAVEQAEDTPAPTKPLTYEPPKMPTMPFYPVF